MSFPENQREKKIDIGTNAFLTEELEKFKQSGGNMQNLLDAVFGRIEDVPLKQREEIKTAIVESFKSKTPAENIFNADFILEVAKKGNIDLRKFFTKSQIDLLVDTLLQVVRDSATNRSSLESSKKAESLLLYASPYMTFNEQFEVQMHVSNDPKTLAFMIASYKDALYDPKILEPLFIKLQGFRDISAYITILEYHCPFGKDTPQYQHMRDMIIQNAVESKLVQAFRIFGEYLDANPEKRNALFSKLLNSGNTDAYYLALYSKGVFTIEERQSIIRVMGRNFDTKFEVFSPLTTNPRIYHLTPREQDLIKEILAFPR